MSVYFRVENEGFAYMVFVDARDGDVMCVDTVSPFVLVF